MCHKGKIKKQKCVLCKWENALSCTRVCVCMDELMSSFTWLCFGCFCHLVQWLTVTGETNLFPLAQKTQHALLSTGRPVQPSFLHIASTPFPFLSISFSFQFLSVTYFLLFPFFSSDPLSNFPFFTVFSCPLFSCHLFSFSFFSFLFISFLFFPLPLYPSLFFYFIF